MSKRATTAFRCLALLSLACGGSHQRSSPAPEVTPATPPETTPGPSAPVPPAGPAQPAEPVTPVGPAPGPPSHWAPASIQTFEILHFDGQSDLEAKLRAVQVVTLELDEIEGAGGRAVSDMAHARGARVICYTSTGFEDWRSDARRYPAAAKGSGICKDEACSSTWPGEAWGDIRSSALLSFLSERADRAAAVGCDGIEFDNMDQAFNDTGLNISADENVAAAIELSRVAHERGLGVVAKNTGELAAAIAPSFDGVFVEECAAYGECDAYLPYRGKLVAMVEYTAPCTRRDWAACNEQDDYFDADGR